MLRLRFGVDDLARTRFACPEVRCELAGSVQALQQPASAFWRQWAARRAPVPMFARRLLELVPRDGDIPSFLIPEADGCFDEMVDIVQATPAERICSDLAQTPLRSTIGPWALGLADGQRNSRFELGLALRSYHDEVLAPLWPAMVSVAEAELRQRAWQWATRGVEETLNSLHPLIRWRDGVLEVELPIDADVDLAGRGLLLAPSTVWTRPGFSFHWHGQPGLSYPIRTHRRDGNGDQQERLAALVGATRARALLALTGERSTSGLAAELGISLASASTHAAALRGAGLVTTQRDGRSVRHQLTELGRQMVTAACPP